MPTLLQRWTGTTCAHSRCARPTEAAEGLKARALPARTPGRKSPFRHPVLEVGQWATGAEAAFPLSPEVKTD